MQLLKKYWLALFAVALLSFEGVGHIDGDLTTLNVKYPGRLSKILVHEGDTIKKGQIIAVQKSDELKARLSRMCAEESAKRDELSAKRTELEIAKKSIPLLLEKANAALRQDGRDYNRTLDLYRKRLIQKEMLEKAELKLDTDKQKLKALMHKKEEVAAAINLSYAELKRARAMQKKIEALEQIIEALEEGIKAVAAAKLEVESMIDDMTLRSPIDGFVVEKIANAGEVLGSGMAVAEDKDRRQSGHFSRLLSEPSYRGQSRPNSTAGRIHTERGECQKRPYTACFRGAYKAS